MVYLRSVGEGRRSGADIPNDISRLTVPEAAHALGISPEAVRNRLSRGTLKSIKEGGTVYVLIDRDRARPTTDISADTSADMIGVLKEQNEYLREQLRREQEAHAEARRIVAGLVQRMPAIEAPPDEREPPETVEQEAERGQPRPGAAGTQEGVQRRSWWRRIIGG